MNSHNSKPFPEETQESSATKQFKHIKHIMLDNIEFFHYAEKFSGHTVVLCSDCFRDIGELIFDFFLLRQTKIRLVIVCDESDIRFIRELNAWNHIGLEFVVVNLESGEEFRKTDPQCFPVYIAKTDRNVPLDLFEKALRVARRFGAKKFFVMGDEPKSRLTCNGKPVTEIDFEHLESLIHSGKNLNLPKSQLSFFLRVVGEGNMDCVLIGKEEGGLFKEIFTHLGYGTLFCKNSQEIVRKGKSEDLLQILFMTKYYESQNVILPIGKEYLLRNITNSYVYEIDRAVVAFAMLIGFGNHAELAKFCTQPRYQGKGKARELALRLIEVAREQRYQAVFALSILPAMWEFFLNLGFVETDRQELPNEWKRNYDLDRPSKAFIKYLQA